MANWNSYSINLKIQSVKMFTHESNEILVHRAGLFWGFSNLMWAFIPCLPCDPVFQSCSGMSVILNTGTAGVLIERSLFTCTQTLHAVMLLWIHGMRETIIFDGNPCAPLSNKFLLSGATNKFLIFFSDGLYKKKKKKNKQTKNNKYYMWHHELED